LEEVHLLRMAFKVLASLASAIGFSRISGHDNIARMLFMASGFRQS